MLKEDAMNHFRQKLTEKIGETYSLKWDQDKKGVVCGWCKLENPEDLYTVAEIIAGYKGRVMTISPLNTPAEFASPSEVSRVEDKPITLIINYHFYFLGLNCTVRITLPSLERKVNSITPVLKSADWHEREMQELYNIKLQGHPNSKRLFLEENIYMTDHTMIPLSEAMNGASTSTLWEKVMKSDGKEATTIE
ncbi:NADH-quinone oxidoreductase subunit C [Bacillus tuaregi]|uniref:NADH-quinone oxidoreductase subunit C n=1 Tax=Bacillus tuaregi TaxID=1816695 RepID=UPI000B015F3E|nr:NADH-quinone oxidoreductase subunit C [Bacillus tuaregi]